MGFAVFNPLVELRGKIGNLSIAKYGDKYRVRRLPTREDRPATAAQEPVRLRFAAATRYARSVLSQPELKAIYARAAQLTGRRAYDLAKADFLNSPKVVDIDLSGYIGQPSGVIRVIAEDDFEVISVRVRILEMDGSVIEEGQATPTRSGGGMKSSEWSYLSTESVPQGEAVVIELTAADRPDHKAVKKVDHVCGPRQG
jgi:hypothetical protein